MTTPSAQMIDAFRIAPRAQKQLSTSFTKPAANTTSRDGSFDDALSAARQTHDAQSAAKRETPPATDAKSSTATETPNAAHGLKRKSKTKNSSKDGETSEAAEASSEQPEEMPEASDATAEMSPDDADVTKDADGETPEANDATGTQAVALNIAATLQPPAAPPASPVTNAVPVDAVTKDVASLKAAAATLPPSPEKAVPDALNKTSDEAKTGKIPPDKVEKLPALVNPRAFRHPPAPTDPAPANAPAVKTDASPPSPLPNDPTSDDATNVAPAAAAPSPFKPPAKNALTLKSDASASPALPSADTTEAAPSSPGSTAAALITASAVDVAKPSSHTTSTDAAPKVDSLFTSAPATSTTAAPAKSASSLSATSATPAQDSPASDANNTFDQIVLGLRTKIDARNGKAEIRLDPPNLGTVRVSVNLQNGALTAQFESSSQQVRDLLQSNMEKLKTTLESQGVTVDKLAVDSAGAKVPAPVSAASVSTHAAANDGRSAGQYHSQGGEQKRSTKDAGNFSKIWGDASDAAPIDLVA